MSALEKDLERKCRQHVENLGGALWKWTSPGRRGVQDRILLLPFAPVVFVELKSARGKYSAQQDLRHWWMRVSGFLAWRIETFEQFEEALENLFVDHPTARN